MIQTKNTATGGSVAVSQMAPWGALRLYALLYSTARPCQLAQRRRWRAPWR